MNIKKAFAKTLRELRKSKNLSQEALALEADLDRTYISMLERGIRQPSLETIFHLSEVLKCKPCEFIQKVEIALKKR